MNWRNIGTLLLVLAVPLALILLFRTGKTHLLTLPVLAGDSATAILRENVDFPPNLEQAHFLLYISESVDNQLNPPAQENLETLAERLEKARAHPTAPVKDIYILSVDNKPHTGFNKTTWLHWQVDTQVDAIVEQMGGGYGRTEQPLEDHLCYLVDKKGQVRATYFAAHGKFVRDILGELVVLENEFKP